MVCSVNIVIFVVILIFLVDKATEGVVAKEESFCCVDELVTTEAGVSMQRTRHTQKNSLASIVFLYYACVCTETCSRDDFRYTS